MKTIGLLGGMSWESAVAYYQLINEAVRERLGGLHSTRLVLHSAEFDEIEGCRSSGGWDRAGAILGCTEIGLLLRQEDTPVPLYDTTVLHAQAAVEPALEEDGPCC